MLPERNEVPNKKILTDIKEKDIVTHKKLGSGATSTVYSGIWDKKDIAIKVITDTNKKSFQQEKKILNIIAQFTEKNFCFIDLYGYVENENTCAIIMKYIPGDTLTNYIKKENPNLPIQYQISLDIIYGLKYLHKYNIIHRDLKIDNVLITSDESKDRAKIFDFGISCIEGEEIDLMAGTPIAMAPEIIKGGNVSTQSDIYSYAILLFSIFSGKIDPYPEFENRYSLMFMIATMGRRPVLPENITIPTSINNLMTRSWSQDPEQRPCAKSVVKYLKDTIKSDKTISILYAGLRDNSLFSVFPKTVIDTIAKNIQDINQQHLKRSK